MAGRRGSKSPGVLQRRTSAGGIRRRLCLQFLFPRR